MTKIVMGLFDEREHAEKAVAALVHAGFSHDNISFAAKTGDGKVALTDTTEHSHQDKGMASGAAIGGAGGALTMGLMLLALPFFGPMIVGGPLMAVLVGAGIGAATGGLVGALADMGVSQDEAELFTEAVRRGGLLIALRCPEARILGAEEILAQHGAINIQARIAEWRQAEWQKPEHAPSSVWVSENDMMIPEYAFEDHLDDFRTHYLNNFCESGYSYEQFEAAYFYGYELGSSEDARTLEWSMIEPEARRDWSELNGGTFEAFKPAIFYAWETARGRAHAGV